MSKTRTKPVEVLHSESVIMLGRGENGDIYIY